MRSDSIKTRHDRVGLTPADSRRYARHIVLKGLGAPGQQRLKAARVLIVGAGGLGAPLVAYLAAAGIGRIGIADDDVVALSNLQRQIVHTEHGIGENKAQSAARFAGALNSGIAVTVLTERITAGNGAALMADFDIIADGTDSFAARAGIAAAAEAARKPLVSGAVSMFDGQVTVFSPHLGDADGTPLPRFVDLYPETPNAESLPSCEAVGVIGALTGVIGTLMAMEVIKLATGIGTPLCGRLLVYDGRGARFSELTYRRR
ncbi:MAG: HesA/MoeB/ThiF family protein [Alphaproteobacteria bacterium]|nr:HesA/MoeB/ThiF family protein [Alphaproteobacteria bacterium]